jgi:hypothetical protein
MPPGGRRAGKFGTHANLRKGVAGMLGEWGTFIMIAVWVLVIVLFARGGG